MAGSWGKKPAVRGVQYEPPDEEEPVSRDRRVCENGTAETCRGRIEQLTIRVQWVDPPKE